MNLLKYCILPVFILLTHARITPEVTICDIVGSIIVFINFVKYRDLKLFWFNSIIAFYYVLQSYTLNNVLSLISMLKFFVNINLLYFLVVLLKNKLFTVSIKHLASNIFLSILIITFGIKLYPITMYENSLLAPFYDSVDVGIVFSLCSILMANCVSSKNKIYLNVSLLAMMLAINFLCSASGTRTGFLLTSVSLIYALFRLETKFILLLTILLNMAFVLKWSDSYVNNSNSKIAKMLVGEEISQLKFDSSLNVRYENFITLVSVMNSFELFFGVGRGQTDKILWYQSNKSIDVHLINLYVEFGVPGLIICGILYYKIILRFGLYGLYLVLFTSIQNIFENVLFLTTSVLITAIFFEYTSKQKTSMAIRSALPC